MDAIAIRTKNGSIYTLEPLTDTTAILSGNKFPNGVEVYYNSQEPLLMGAPLTVTITRNPANGKYAGCSLQTSAIERIRRCNY